MQNDNNANVGLDATRIKSSFIILANISYIFVGSLPAFRPNTKRTETDSHVTCGTELSHCAVKNLKYDAGFGLLQTSEGIFFGVIVRCRCDIGDGWQDWRPDHRWPISPLAPRRFVSAEYCWPLPCGRLGCYYIRCHFARIWNETVNDFSIQYSWWEFTFYSSLCNQRNNCACVIQRRAQWINCKRIDNIIHIK